MEEFISTLMLNVEELKVVILEVFATYEKIRPEIQPLEWMVFLQLLLICCVSLRVGRMERTKVMKDSLRERKVLRKLKRERKK
jgi:hypothetical protein